MSRNAKINLEEAKKTGHKRGKIEIDRALKHHALSDLVRGHYEDAARTRVFVLQNFRRMATKISTTSKGAPFSEAEIQALTDGYMEGAIERLKELAQ